MFEYAELLPWALKNIESQALKSIVIGLFYCLPFSLLVFLGVVAREQYKSRVINVTRIVLTCMLTLCTLFSALDMDAEFLEMTIFVTMVALVSFWFYRDEGTPVLNWIFWKKILTTSAICLIPATLMFVANTAEDSQDWVSKLMFMLPFIVTMYLCTVMGMGIYKK